MDYYERAEAAGMAVSGRTWLSELPLLETSHSYLCCLEHSRWAPRPELNIGPIKEAECKITREGKGEREEGLCVCVCVCVCGEYHRCTM